MVIPYILYKTFSGDSNKDKVSENDTYQSLDGQEYDTLEEAKRADEEVRRQGLLDTAKADSERSLEDLERRIKASGASQKELAERVGARQQGQLLSQLERSILGTGGESQTLDALVPQVQEQGERSLLDRVQAIESDTLGKLTQVPQLEVSNITNMAQLGQTQQRIADSMSQFLIDDERQKAVIQADIDSQPEWWEGVLGSVAQGAGAALTAYALGSDIRIKENISQVG